MSLCDLIDNKWETADPGPLGVFRCLRKKRIPFQSLNKVSDYHKSVPLSQVTVFISNSSPSYSREGLALSTRHCSSRSHWPSIAAPQSLFKDVDLRWSRRHRTAIICRTHENNLCCSEKHINVKCYFIWIITIALSIFCTESEKRMKMVVDWTVLLDQLCCLKSRLHVEYWPLLNRVLFWLNCFVFQIH